MVAVVVVAFDGDFFDGSIHAFDLSVGPFRLVQGWLGLVRQWSHAMRPAGAVDDHEEIKLARRQCALLPDRCGSSRLESCRTSAVWVSYPPSPADG